MSKHAVKEIADRLGDAQIAAACDVSEHSVRHARWKGAFPASWFPAVRELCRVSGLACPESAFNFKPSALDAATEAAE